MKVLRALLLILALSVSASAGWMESDKTGNIPNVRAGEIHTDRTGDIPNDETGEMDQGNAGNMPNEVARLAWQFLHSVLPLF